MNEQIDELTARIEKLREARERLEAEREELIRQRSALMREHAAVLIGQSEFCQTQVRGNCKKRPHRIAIHPAGLKLRVGYGATSGVTTIAP